MEQYEYSWVLLILYALLAGIGVFVVTVAWLGLLGRTTFSDMKGSRAASMTANIAIMFTGMVTMATAITLAFSDQLNLIQPPVIQMIPPWLVVLMVLNVTWAAILIVVSILGMASYDAFCVKNENQAVFILMRILIVFVSTASILGTGFVALTLRD